MNELEAELYALIHRGNPGDMEFYGRACRKAPSVLELGTGYGRLLPVLSQAAREVVGIELERALLAAARRRLRELPAAQRRRVKLHEGDMQAFDLGRRFQRILLPYNGLYCLLGRRRVVQCFRSVRAHLAPGGLFIADVWAADGFHRHAGSSGYRDDSGPIVSIHRGADVWDVFEQSRLKRRSQRLDVTYTYCSRRRTKRVETRVPQRYLLSGELSELLGRAGLELEAVYGDFKRRPFRVGMEHLIFVAKARA